MEVTRSELIEAELNQFIEKRYDQRVVRTPPVGREDPVGDRRGRARDVQPVPEGVIDSVGRQDDDVARPQPESRWPHSWELVPGNSAPKRE